MENKEKMMNERTAYWDWLRVLATFMVVMLHVNATNWYGSPVKSFDWQVMNVYSSLVRWSVPVFVMISGAVFLRQDIDIKKIYTKYVPRMAVAYLFWCVVYYLYAGDSIKDQLLGLVRPGFGNKIAALLAGSYHMWFVLMIMGIYMCVPIIKVISDNEKVTRYYLTVGFIMGYLIPEVMLILKDFGNSETTVIAASINGIVDSMGLNVVLGFSIFFILGRYMAETEFNNRQKKIIYGLGILGALATILLSSLASLRVLSPIGDFYGNNTVNVVLMAIAVFELFKNMKLKSYKFITLLSKWSFGAYLVHLLILDLLRARLGVNTVSFAPIISIPLISLLVFVLAMAVSAILNQIPVLKKYIV